MSRLFHLPVRALAERAAEFPWSDGRFLASEEEGIGEGVEGTGCAGGGGGGRGSGSDGGGFLLPLRDDGGRGGGGGGGGVVGGGRHVAEGLAARERAGVRSGVWEHPGGLVVSILKRCLERGRGGFLGDD